MSNFGKIRGTLSVLEQLCVGVDMSLLHVSSL